MNKPEIIAGEKGPRDAAWGASSAADGPLWQIKVLDLTHARAGPTCVRQLTDWGARALKIEQPSGVEDVATGDRHGFDFQNLHRNKRSLTLKSEGSGRPRHFQGTGEGSRCHRREFSAGGEGSPRRRLRDDAQDQSAADLCQPFRLRRYRPVPRPSGCRSDFARHGRADVDHRPAGTGARAGRHPDLRPDRRRLPVDGGFDGAL